MIRQALMELRSMSGVFMFVFLISLVPGTSSPDHQQIFAGHTGTNITLEFHVPNGTTSVWLKRPGSDKYIFHCRDGHSIRPEDQEESFKGRVEGTKCDKINGTFSVTVRNLLTSDNGTYEFHGVDNDGRRFNKTKFLTVTDAVNPLVYVMCGGPVVCIVVGLIYKGRRRKPQISPNDPRSVNLQVEDDDAAFCPSEKKSSFVAE